MLDGFSSFKSYSMSEIWNLIGLYYTFYKQLDISSYVMNLLYNNKSLYNNIRNISNWDYSWDNISDKTISPMTIFSFYYYWHNCDYF